MLGFSSHLPENPLVLTLPTGMEWRVWGQVESRVTSEGKVVDVAGKILPGREVCVGRASSDFLTPNQRWNHKAIIITIINKGTIKTNTHDSRHLCNCSYVPGTALDDLLELTYLIPNTIIWDFFFLFLIFFKVKLNYSVVLITAVEQSDQLYIHICCFS